ncbi:MAG TPA: class II fructose-bisphosphate aldolase, partial [Steroidobacteraceae bacterium]|nr:class II fructose-bisphosphate aldolase [Steroidobacteraceae bacterium]
MSLESIAALMQHAQRHSYAVGYFESWNLESLQGVIDAAEQSRAPLIIGFNGEFLSRRPGASVGDIDLYAALGVAAAARATVPCGFIFNECSNDAWVEYAMGAGFNLVMPADPEAGLDAYTQRVSRLTKLAHARGVAVEAEIDELPCGDTPGAASDPDVAARFVAETGVDMLAVSVGNEHIRLEGSAPLDLDRLERIRRRVKIPLVLHGGSGIEAGSLKAAVAAGIRKVNYGT